MTQNISRDNITYSLAFDIGIHRNIRIYPFIEVPDYYDRSIILLELGYNRYVYKIPKRQITNEITDMLNSYQF